MIIIIMIIIIIIIIIMIIIIMIIIIIIMIIIIVIIRHSHWPFHSGPRQRLDNRQRDVVDSPPRWRSPAASWSDINLNLLPQTPIIVLDHRAHLPLLSLAPSTPHRPTHCSQWPVFYHFWFV